MCGVNQPSVRRIILNFKKTGSPSIPKKLSQKEKLKPFVEYDEDGNLIDSEDESTPIEPPTLKEKIRARRPSAKDLIAYVLSKAQQSNKDVVKNEEDMEGEVLQLSNKWRPPTPPQDQQQQALNEQQYRHEQRELIHSPPLSESSNNSSSSASPQMEYQVIKGFESWTIEEDKILMAHVLTRLSGCRWKEAELKLRGKHSAQVCEQRWQQLRDLLIHGADKSGTRGW
ncbi:unnamed protein product [Mucor hiemalis]